MNTDKVTSVLFAGIGGQGVIRASDLLSEAAFRMGFDVKKSELHGMSQRGGSVSSDVRFGGKVASPMIPAGEADFLIALSPGEEEVCALYLNEKTQVIRNTDLPEEYRESRMANIAMLGLLNLSLAFPEELWLDLIREQFDPAAAEDNIRAFRSTFSRKEVVNEHQ